MDPQPSHETPSLIFVWLDEDVDTDRNKLALQRQLKRNLEHFEVFNQPRACIAYIQSAEDKQVVLVISPHFAEVTRTLHNLTQLLEFYIYTSDELGDKQWTTQYEKVNRSHQVRKIYGSRSMS
jgi:hypothetical protein